MVGTSPTMTGRCCPAMPLYFAYGANMDVAAMAQRCPNSKPLGLGGPTGVSRPQPYGSASFYPIDGWLAKGALVLEPNYRGSAGYGEAFRSLNVRNLGIGDAWDVLSGIDYLVAQGLVDKRPGRLRWAGARAATSRRS